MEVVYEPFEHGRDSAATRSAEQSTIFVEAYEADLVVLRRWEEFHEKALGFALSWGAYACRGSGAGKARSLDPPSPRRH